MGSWPRRLLHVPTMTSLEWQPGNFYGNYKAPKYNAISYTWGRWRLREGQKVDAQALKIRGISWPVPRIDPSHFTARQLHRAIKQATSGTTKSNQNLHENIEFLWIDIACIDLRRGEPRSAAEMGRQAAIFRQATDTYAWISTKTFSDFERIFAVFEKLPKQPENAGAHIKPAFTCLREIIEDPWFSSVWTLQEAFLRALDTEFISRDGHLIRPPRGHSIDAPPSGGLRDFVSSAIRIENLCHQVQLQDLQGNHWEPQLVQASQDLSKLLSDKGLRALDSQHPTAVYRAAMERTASNDCDYAYGIQQVFNLRVGSSSALTGSQRSYSRSELEQELGEQLLAKQPVLSQLFVQSEPVKSFGDGWHITKSSIVPVNSFLSNWTTTNHNNVGYCKPSCYFSSHRIGDMLWAKFEGLTCSFKDLESHCQRLDRDPGKMVPHGSTVLQLLLDNIPELQKCPQVTTPQSSKDYDFHGTRTGPQMKACRKWLAQHYNNKLVVLLLSRRMDDDVNPYQRLGLLLSWRPSLTSPGRYWQRIGICQWSYKWPGLQTEPNLQGEGKLWKRTEGLFG